jgi:hypothetical protein
MKVELTGGAFCANMEVPAHFGSAAMVDGPNGASLCLAHGVTVFTHMGGQEAQQGIDDGGGHDRVAEYRF